MANIVTEPWYKKAWRPTAAFVYLFICVVDFVVMPLLVEINNESTKPAEILQAAVSLKESTTQIAFINAYANKRTWQPLTLEGAAAFHLAFGAIVTGAVITRGMQNKEFAKNGTLVS